MKLKTYRFNRIKNTNDKAIQIIKKDNIKNGIIIANFQTKGKGQYGRSWISYKGNLFITVFLCIQNTKFSILNFTKFNCKIVKSILSNYTRDKITIKPPNDILIKNKKICGILQERMSINDNEFILIGIGVNLIKSPIIKKYPTTNLYELTKKKININRFYKDIKLSYELFLNKFLKLNKKFY